MPDPVVATRTDDGMLLREPGFEYKETIASGLRSAAAGGFTGVAGMANTEPVNDDPAVTKYILDRAAQAEFGLDHRRSGDLVCVSKTKAWFTYYYWLDDARAPDFARTVDIHRKPGYDPCELFFDPKLAVPKLRMGRKLVAKKLGFRYLMDVVPLDPSLVKGSHGLLPLDGQDGPVLVCQDRAATHAVSTLADLKAYSLQRMGL